MIIPPSAQRGIHPPDNHVYQLCAAKCHVAHFSLIKLSLSTIDRPHNTSMWKCGINLGPVYMIPARRDGMLSSRLAGKRVACLYGQKHCRDEAVE